MICSMSMQVEDSDHEPSLRPLFYTDAEYEEALALARQRVEAAQQLVDDGPPAVTAVGGTAPWKDGDNVWEGHHFKVDIGEPPFATLVAYLPGTTCEPMLKEQIERLTDRRCVIVQPSMVQLNKAPRGKAYKARREIYVCMYIIIYVCIARCICKMFRVRLPCVLSPCVFLVCVP
jgi:hypothetical protein